MATSVILEDNVEIPLVSSLQDFRVWVKSDTFPLHGRIDYMAGHIEVAMSPESLFSHGTLKVEIARVLANRAKRLELGHVFSDRTRVSCVRADLSAEPDVIVLLHQSLDEQLVKLIPKTAGDQFEFVEIEGPPDLIVEIVSDSSVGKDTQRLPDAYFSAGVKEYWLVDARGSDLIFHIHERGALGFAAKTSDEETFQLSSVLDCRFRLERRRDRHGHWVYDLIESDR